MNNELLSILEYIEQERGINRDQLVGALEAAILSASKKSIHPASDITVKMDPKTGDIRAWAKLEVVDGLPTVDQLIIARAQEFGIQNFPAERVHENEKKSGLMVDGLTEALIAAYEKGEMWKGFAD